MLQARFIADLEKYNEWMNEEDYIIAEDDDDDDDEAERGDADDTAEVSPSYFLRSLSCHPPPPTPPLSPVSRLSWSTVRACHECCPSTEEVPGAARET